MNPNTNPVGNPIVTNLTITSADDQGDFQRFEDLAGKLVQVSKEEVDEKRRKAS